MSLTPTEPPVARRAAGHAARRSRIVAGLAGLAIVALAVVLSAQQAGRATTGGSPAPSIDRAAYAPFAYSPAELAPPLRLIDQTGRRFSIESLRGRTFLVSFGYMNCPDVCPTTLAISRDAILARPDTAAAIFITVDPERDTPAALGSFLAYFGAPMTGLTGTPAEIQATTAAWKVSFQKGEVNAGGGYAMNHTAGIYVVDPAGRLRFHYPYGTPASLFIEVVDGLRR